MVFRGTDPAPCNRPNHLGLLMKEARHLTRLKARRPPFPYRTFKTITQILALSFISRIWSLRLEEGDFQLPGLNGPLPLGAVTVESGYGSLGGGRAGP